ncbi:MULTISPECIES: DUF1998 domain-containing protein [Gordonia]|uniref:DUF1998 domain-containing protein n=1 Tax=Gordonia amicalis TaxID=89053 RepID=A0AAE4RAN9_9ACTN|nr:MULTISPECIES: DUF1998 domain-containing protein [Gordonia]ATD70957.1 hypothetical protein CNO18_12460 [Gordonia sp. 1D]MCZ4581322.1 DUF1998 domain-containing protein [Gordonia amicalis]MCZ4653870.1 DUF1998 domain-containing protein [Gordonia amicalis]MDJ0455395.1 DUF1998 domain-containing protein [Gordonia amicalis]MDV6307438.1 DUF1998 domain-containing protein [Gordonia amicalis]
MTENTTSPDLHEDGNQPVSVGTKDLDPIADIEAKVTKNRSKVGSLRPSALLYTSGIGATVDLPHLSVMPHGLDGWQRYYDRRPGGADVIVEPRLLDLVRAYLGDQVDQLRKAPWAPEMPGGAGDDAVDLGIPARVFPQWLRCTGCNRVAPVNHQVFEFRNVLKYRPDQAQFVHENCKGWDADAKKSKSRKGRPQTAVPARYLIACINGHLDEFPYVAWVHRGQECPKARIPQLRMREWKSNIGPDVQIICLSCDARRGMLEATGPKASEKLPRCRGRHPHLDAFYKCDQPGKLMMLGAANQWFASTVGLLALPREESASADDVVPHLQALPPNIIAAATSRDSLQAFRLLAGNVAQTDIFDSISDDALWDALTVIKSGGSSGVQAPASTDPTDILLPEWLVLTDRVKYTKHSGAADFRAVRRNVPDTLQPIVTEVVAVEKLKKVNAFVGFTRIDALDRIDDSKSRVAPLNKRGRPNWVPATEDRGEGFFLQFDEEAVGEWEEKILGLPIWETFRQAHALNFNRRTSKTADTTIDPDSRFPAPRYWAIHTLSHLLIREAAMSSGYGSASLTERIYAWRRDGDRPAAAGLLITTTASDSEGTLGGLVDLSRPERLGPLVHEAIRRGGRCSSDPVCSHRRPQGKEDFLHGAACHFCLFVSETSCERTNRFLDRRLLLGLLVDKDVATPGLLTPIHGG